MNDCNKCHNPCDRGCSPAQYGPDFYLGVDPNNPYGWVASLNGALFKGDIPVAPETDTSLIPNYETATLDFTAEAHKDSLTGHSIGQLINVDDMRDTRIDYSLPGNCYEFIYKQGGGCPDGNCASLEDAWVNWNVNSEGAKQNGIRYVRGAGLNCCPSYLNTPANTAQYWWALWRPVSSGYGMEFGYEQTEERDEPIMDEKGDYVVLSEDPETKKPVKYSIPIRCWIESLVGSLGVGVEGTIRIIKGTPGLSATIKPGKTSARWQILWNDWYGARNPNTGQYERHVGSGQVDGQMFFSSSFDFKTGAVTYEFDRIRVETVQFKTDQGIPSGSSLTYTMTGSIVDPLTQNKQVVYLHTYDGNSDWRVDVRQSYPVQREFTLQPGESTGAFDFFWIYVACSDQDDELYVQANFTNKINEWTDC